MKNTEERPKQNYIVNGSTIRPVGSLRQVEPFLNANVYSICVSPFAGPELEIVDNIDLSDSILATDRLVSIQDSVYTIYASNSHIGILAIRECLIRQLHTPGSTVDMLKTVVSTLLEPYNPNMGELRNSALTKSHGFPDRPMVLYKKARIRILNMNPFASDCRRTEEVIVKLSVPCSALRHYDPMSKKIRVSEAVVAGFYDMEHKEIKLSKLHRLLKRYLVTSFRDYDFKYWLNKTVKPIQPFADNDETCASGIHGFVEFDDAVSYNWP